jgi:hypothetical protein
MLLKNFVTESQATEMLHNEKHPTWESPEFQSNFAQQLSKGQIEALKLCLGAVTELQQQLAHYRGRQIAWGTDGKTKINNTLYILKQRTNELHSLNRAWKKSRRNEKESSQYRKISEQPNTEQPRTITTGDVAKHLSSRFRNRICPCRRFYLKLTDVVPTKTGSEATVEFQFVMEKPRLLFHLQLHYGRFRSSHLGFSGVTLRLLNYMATPKTMNTSFTQI